MNRITLALAGFAVIPLCTAGAQTLQNFSGTPRNAAQVVVFADGGVKNVVGQPNDATTSSGSLGVAYLGSNFMVSGIINVLSRADTITRGYGATLLPPASGKALNSALLDVRSTGLGRAFVSWCPSAIRSYCKQIGLHAYLSASTATWATDTTAAGVPSATTEVPIWGSGLGLYYRFFDGSVGDSGSSSNRVGMALDATWATRHVRGDVTARDAATEQLRERLLGTTRVDFNALELGLNIRYNEVNVGLEYYAFGGEVPGLSRGQIVAAVSVRARLNGGLFHDRK